MILIIHSLSRVNLGFACICIQSKETDSRGRTVDESKASDGVRYADVGRRVTERYETRVIRLYRWVKVFFLLQEHAKHPREIVITLKGALQLLSNRHM